MRVITPGTIAPKTRLLGSCRNCRCFVEATHDEVKRTNDPKDNIPSGLYVDCPTAECGKKIPLILTN